VSPPGGPRAKLALRSFYFAAFSVLGIVLPFFPRWLEGRGATGLAMGAIMATLPAMGLLGPPVFGVLADTFQLRRSLLGLACGGGALAFGAIALLSGGASPIGFGGLFALVAIFAFFRSPVILLGDVIALEEVGGESARYGRIRLWGSIGFMVASVVTGSLVDLGSATAWPTAVAGSLAFAFVVSLALPARGALPPSPAVGRARALFREGPFRLLLLATFAGYLGQSAYDLAYSLHLRDLGMSSAQIGVAWGIGVVAEIGLMASSTRIFARARPTPLLVVAWSAAALRYALVALVKSPMLQLALQPSHAIAFALFWIAAIEHNKRHVADEVRATALGLFMAAISAGGVVGMLVWGAVYRHGGGVVTFALASGCSVVAAMLGWVLVRRIRPASPRS
jgi:PPP family 3-phenylpropionic acid transporter